MGNNDAYSTRSVGRAFSILEHLDKSYRRWNISEISRKLKIPKSTAHVLILTLEKLGYVTKVSGSNKYGLGAKARELGNRTRLRQILSAGALPHLESLTAHLKLTAHVAMLEEQQAVYIQKAPGPGLIQFDTYIGKRTNLHCTAVGKVLLAFAPSDFTGRFLAKASLIKHTQSTISSTTGLRKALETIRKQGYAMDDQEEELDVRCLAVPIFKKTGECVAALSVTGTTRQIDTDNSRPITTQMKATASEIMLTEDPLEI